MKRLIGFLVLGLSLLAFAARAQQMQSSPGDQLTQCQALVRVRQNTMVNMEQLTASLLARSEKAEQELTEMAAKVTQLEQELEQLKK